MSPATPAGSSPGTASGRLLADGDRDDLRARWRRITERFVDDPSAAVRDADELIGQTIDRIRASLDERRAGTRSGWADVDEATTEQLREALHHYEILFDQLADAPAPASWKDQHG